MSRAGKVTLVAGVVVAVGVSGTVFAYAGGWALPDNRVSFTAKVATMPRGAEPSVAKQGGQAVVSWSAQEIAPGVRMDHYTVTAHSISDPPRPDVTHTVAATGGSVESLTFTVGEVAGGRWRWTIVPRFRLWAGAESKRSQRLTFPAGPAAREVAVTAPAPTTGSDPITRSPAPATSTSPAPETTTEEPRAEPETSAPAPADSVPAPVASASSAAAPPPAEER